MVYAHKHIEFIVLLLVVAAHSFATYQRNSIWKNDVTLWGDVAKKSPQKARPYNNLGLAYKERGLIDKAIKVFAKSIALTPDIALISDVAKPHYNLGLCYVEKGLTDRAMVEFDRTIRVNPYSAEAYSNLGICYFKKGWVDKAISRFEHAIKIDPDYADAHYNLGVAYGSKGQYDLAFKEIKAAKKLLGSGTKWEQIAKTIKGDVMSPISGHP